MIIAEFPQLYPCVFPDGVFVVEPEATLSRLEVGDASLTMMTIREGNRQGTVRCKC